MKSRARVDWAEAAGKLAAKIPRTQLHPAVLKRAGSGNGRERWAVAFSGGADSLALLLLLWAHWPERRGRLRVLHFDHHLRGRESERDAKFCARVCADLGVQLISEVSTHTQAGVSEADARDWRLAFFVKHTRVFWLGHQQTDVAESMLMRLARGSGSGGLAAPRPVQLMPRGRVHLRPLLTIKKGEITAALREADAKWREDSTNLRGKYFRNRIRLDVLPRWVEAAQRDAVAGAARSRELLAEDDVALESWLADLDVMGPRRTLCLAKLAGKPRALWRRALHRWLLAEPRAGEISRTAFEALLGAIEQGRRTRHSIGRLGFAVTDGAVLRFERVRAR